MNALPVSDGESVGLLDPWGPAITKLPAGRRHAQVSVPREA